MPKVTEEIFHNLIVGRSYALNLNNLLHFRQDLTCHRQSDHRYRKLWRVQKRRIYKRPPPRQHIFSRDIWNKGRM